MKNLDGLLKDIVRRTRTCRNLKKQHCAAIDTECWDFDYLTPYETGRMTREVPRLGRDLVDLKNTGNEKLAFWLYMFIIVSDIQPTAFGMKDSGTWHELHQWAEPLIANMAMGDVQSNITFIHETLDHPSADVPCRMMLLKLMLR